MCDQPDEIYRDADIVAALEVLLENFVAERRMKLSDPGSYVPCYRLVG